MRAPSKTAVGLFVTVAFAALRLAGIGVIRETDQRLLDLKFRLRGPRAPATTAALVAIDQKSLQEIGGWPWPREKVGELVRAISAGGAMAIGLDLVFSEPSRDPRSDEALAGALDAAGNAVPGALFYISPGEGRFQTQAEYEDNLARLDKARVNIIRSLDSRPEPLKLLTAYGALANIPAISRAARGGGFYNVVPERDGCIRYSPLVLQASGRVYHSLAVALARVVWGAGNVELITEGGYARKLLLHGPGGDVHEAPVDRLGRLCINYYGKGRFPSFRASEVLAGATPAGAFRGRIVLVGGTSLGDFDMAETPVDPAMPSIEVQATILDNILGGRALVAGYPAMACTWLFILVPGIALSLFLPRSRSMLGGASFACGLFAACALADFLLFARYRVVIESFYPLAAVACGYAAMQVYGYALLARAVRRIGQALSGVDEAAGARLDIDRFLPAVLRFLVAHLDARRGLILTAREGALRWAEGQVPGDRGVFQGLDRDAFTADGYSFARGVMRAAAADGAPRLAGKTPRGCEAGSLAVVPLVRRGEVTGLVCVDSGRDGARLSTDELKILAALAPPLRVAIENAWLYSDLRQEKDLLRTEVTHLRREIEGDRRFKGMIGDGPAMRAVHGLIEKAASSSISVLIEGETGTGKELVARAIHSLGERSGRVMVTQNCAALPEQLLESELFGHTRGAFTGAVSDKKGLFEIADGGTMFLDEIGDAPPSVQAKLLRVLQEGMIRPIGGVREKKVDVRTLSATNKNLEEEVHKGAFREDLYYRLNAFQVRVLPLREHREDIPLLASHFLEKYSREMNKNPRGYSSSAFALLCGYEYPGNIRELENLIQRAVAMTPDGELVQPDVFPDKIRIPAGLRRPAAGEGGETRPLKEALEMVERQLVTAALSRHKNNRTSAAAELGITRSGLRLVMKRLGLLGES